MVIVTYGKKNSAKLGQCPSEEQMAPESNKLSDRVQFAISSVENRLKRLSMTVKETQSSLKQKQHHHLLPRRMSFVRAIDGAKMDHFKAIQLADLEKLQTAASAHLSFNLWLAEKVNDGWGFEKIAESTFSEVFRGTNQVNHNKLVLKVMPLALLNTESDHGHDITPIPVTLDAAFHEISALLAIQGHISKVNRYAVPSSWTGFANILEYYLSTNV